MATVHIKGRTEAFDFTTSSTAYEATELRFYDADTFTVSAASDLLYSFEGVDGEDKTGQVGKTIPAGSEWAENCDRRKYMTKGYFSVFVWSATASVAVDGVAGVSRGG